MNVDLTREITNLDGTPVPKNNQVMLYRLDKPVKGEVQGEKKTFSFAAENFKTKTLRDIMQAALMHDQARGGSKVDRGYLALKLSADKPDVSMEDMVLIRECAEQVSSTLEYLRIDMYCKELEERISEAEKQEESDDKKSSSSKGKKSK